jgi:serine/threonine protein kinase
MAPEVLSEEAGKSENKTEYNTKCEVYSFGILLWEIAECRTPYSQFKDIKDVSKNVIDGYQESFTESTDIPKKYQDLVNKAVGHDPDSRPTFAKMLVKLQSIFKEYIPIRGLSSWINNAIKEKLIEHVDWGELSNLSEAGSGRFGSVSKAHWSRKNDYVALKKLIISSDIRGDEMNALKHEIQMQHRAHTCENVIRFLGITKGSILQLQLLLIKISCMFNYYFFFVYQYHEKIIIV